MKTIDAAIENVRRISRALGPSIVEDFGLLSAVQRHAHGLMKNSAIKVSAELMDVDAALGAKSQMIIYRVIEEALRNVEQHSEAAHVSIAIRKEDDFLVFCVEDDGKGCAAIRPVEEPGQARRLGLSTMHDAARILEGTLDIQSAQGKGTKITLRIPIEKTLSTALHHARPARTQE